jgi:Lipocalin-like domain
MKVLYATLLLAASSLAQNATPAPTVAQLLGTWKLVSIEDTMTDGKVQPSVQFGSHPYGFIMYEPDGHMCATIANGDRPAWKDPAKPTDAEKIAYFDTFIAYCGSFKLDSETSTVTHYPSVAWTPAYVGSTQPRPFRLEGDRLIITATRGLSNPAIQKRVLVWERAK